MGMLDFLKGSNEETEETEEPEEDMKELFRSSLKGMNERQLLKLLILLKLDENTNIADNYAEIIEIAKEE